MTPAEYARDYRARNADRLRDYRAANRDRRRENNRRWREANRESYTEYQRAKHLETKYGLSVEEFEAMRSRQNGRCLICGTASEDLVVDHDHETGKVRGLVDGRCNLMIGQALDNPDVLRAAAEYLEKNRG